MKHLVLGMGEVGKAIYEVLLDKPINGLKEDCYQLGWQDVGKRELHFAGNPNIMHVCIRYSEEFKTIVKQYIEQYKPLLVVVHSSVPIGTCDPEGWVHSPIRGVHPNIADGVRKFVKFFGGSHSELAAHSFSVLGVKTVSVERAKDCEAAKAWDTTQYGWMIELNKEIFRWCEKHGIDFNIVYTEFNKTYNAGFERLGRKEVARPYLSYVEGPIGGHCVIPNLEFLKDSQVANLIEMMNKVDIKLKEA